MSNKSELIKFLTSARNLINKLPKYNSKYSNKIYDNHQKMIILVFRQKMRMTYRGIVKFFRFSGLARALIGLKKVPDHSTLVKFAKRIPVPKLDSLLCKKKVRIIAVDSSGFETNHMSYHYANAWNSQDKRRHKNYLKVSIAIDTDNQYIMAQKVRIGPRNDIIDFKTLIKNLRCDYVVADKGYCSKANHHFVLRMKAIPMIARKKNTRVYYEKLGVPLKIDKRIYHQRSKAETVFSVLKRKYSSLILSKNFESQKREILMRMVAYNIDRKIILSSLVIIGIHQSRFILDLSSNFLFSRIESLCLLKSFMRWDTHISIISTLFTQSMKSISTIFFY